MRGAVNKPTNHRHPLARAKLFTSSPYFHPMPSYTFIRKTQHMSSSSQPAMIPASGCEPDLSSVCKRDSPDSVTLRNVIYTLWAVNKECTDHSNCSIPSNCYLVGTHVMYLKNTPTLKSIPQGYTIKRLEGRGYLVLAFFGSGYRISQQDMQLLMDVCPLRIDSMFVRGLQDGDLPDHTSSSTPRASAVLSISVLDANQPVRITEAEVVCVRKRSRGLLLSSSQTCWFGMGKGS